MKAMRDGRNDMGCLIWAYDRSPLELLKKGNDIAGYAGLVLPRSAEDREAPDMCLSNVFVCKRDDGALVAREASSVTDLGGKVEVQTLFGEKQVLEGYRIREVNLVKNYIVLDR